MSFDPKEMTTGEAAAFRRGAEAMREAAARAADKHGAAGCGNYAGAAIRALPLPEAQS